jgi:hypothetical protein
MKKIKGFLKNKYAWILLGIIFLGVFLRAYNFSPWLHFELDQARDALLINEAVEDGIGNLPLLGPRAAGTMLRLGPAFYYLEYIGSLIVGDTVVGSAGVVLFFSVLSIPLFYVFSRRYFSKRISLALLAVFASSLFLVTYSRFAWNPNLIPFFILAMMYCLLRVVDHDEDKKGTWLIFAAIVFSFITHFHFLALIISSGVAGLFLLYKRPKIQLKFWIIAVAVFALISSPMLVNETKTGGDNFGEFVGAITKKSDESPVPLVEKFARNLNEHFFWHETILTGYQESDLPKLERKKSGGYGVECDRYCRDHMIAGLFGFAIVVLGGALLVWRIYKERNVSKKDFLVLNFLVFFVSFVIFTPLSFDLSPRFFLIECVAPFVFLGLVFEQMKRIKGGRHLIVPGAVILVVLNLSFVNIFFNQLNLANEENIDIGRDRILKQKTRITLEQQVAITDFMKKKSEENGFPVFHRGQNEFHRTFTYLLEKEGIVRDGISMSDIYEEGNYFLILRSQSSLDSYVEKYSEKFEFVSKKEFGTLTVFELSPRPESITEKSADIEELTQEEEEPLDKKARRYKWNEIF